MKIFNCSGWLLAVALNICSVSSWPNLINDALGGGYVFTCSEGTVPTGVHIPGFAGSNPAPATNHTEARSTVMLPRWYSPQREVSALFGSLHIPGNKQAGEGLPKRRGSRNTPQYNDGGVISHPHFFQSAQLSNLRTPPSAGAREVNS